MHVEDCKRHKNRQCDNFLHDLELRQRKLRVADPVGWNLKQIFEQRDAPADQCGDKPFPPRHVAQVGIPRKGHEDVGKCQQERRLKRGGNENQFHKSFRAVNSAEDRLAQSV